MAIYKTRWLAEANRHGGGRVVKVMGGYAVLSARQYQVMNANRRRA